MTADPRPPAGIPCVRRDDDGGAVLTVAAAAVLIDGRPVEGLRATIQLDRAGLGILITTAVETALGLRP